MEGARTYLFHADQSDAFSDFLSLLFPAPLWHAPDPMRFSGRRSGWNVYLNLVHIHLVVFIICRGSDDRG